MMQGSNNTASLLDFSAFQGTWRLVPLLHTSGRVQMAIDTWLLEQHRLGLHPPTLRFYTWSPPAISLGYHQRQYPSEWQQLTWQGQALELVRRPSGGRAVLHQGDLTYAVVASGFQGKRTEVYQQICQFLLEGWRSLGVELHYGQAGRGYIRHANCFGTSTGADLVFGTTKLIGSAQLYREGSVLQHGSMRLTTDATLYAQVFGENLPPLTLPTQLHSNPISQIIDALTEAARYCFGINFIEQPLSEGEWASILGQSLVEMPQP
jgi:lipoate---protein ligase